MARPQKQTVDYFPHRCKHGKTMFIVESKYGDKGYVVWFKTLELLGVAIGHSYDFDNAESIQYFLAYCRIEKTQAVAILDTLAELGAIDHELWSNHHIIWSDNFVEGIQDVYRNRKSTLPAKPFLTVETHRGGVSDSRIAITEKQFLTVETHRGGVSDSRIAITDVRNGVSDIKSTQSKVKETKVKETKVNNDNDVVLPDWIKQENWDGLMEVRKKKRVPNTPRALQLIISNLENLKSQGYDPNAVLDQSCERGWASVFEIKGGNGNGPYRGHTEAHESLTDRLQKSVGGAID